MNQFDSFQLIWSTLQLKCHGKGNLHRNDASAQISNPFSMRSVQSFCIYTLVCLDFILVYPCHGILKINRFISRESMSETLSVRVLLRAAVLHASKCIDIFCCVVGGGGGGGDKHCTWPLSPL